MSARFHVNPETGITSPCSANVRSCPHGEAFHGNTREEAIVNFEKAMEKQEVTTKEKASQANNNAVKVDELVGFYNSMEDANKAAWAARARGDFNVKKQKLAEAEKYKEKYNALVSELENSGNGHLVPDFGSVLRVNTKAQKILFEDELIGQIIVDLWENTAPYDHWKYWSHAKVVVDPKNPGRNLFAVKDNYQLNATQLLDAVGDRMVESVQKGTGNDKFSDKPMRQELKELRSIFKTSRPVRTPDRIKEELGREKKNSVPDLTKKIISQTKNNSTMFRNTGHHGSDSNIGTVLTHGPGVGIQKKTIDKYHGKINPTSGDGDTLGNYGKGTMMILGKSDGSRARAVLSNEDFDPEKNLGCSWEQYKKTSGKNLSVTKDLFFLGYVDNDGNKWGWIPNKKINYFTNEDKI